MAKIFSVPKGNVKSRRRCSPRITLSIRIKSSARPIPFLAEIAKWSGQSRHNNGNAACASGKSILLKTTKTGKFSALIFCKSSVTAIICAAACEWEVSTTCKSNSASRTSSNVERNAATKWWGSFWIKPTVSVSKKRLPSGSSTWRVVGSSVAKSLSSTNTSASVKALSKVDFPALV